ncbi:type III secretion system chaperone [Pantoea sp. 18069]|uniref:type III secretion system chaperone n=1 Tax=Pantoea sp. 18069 TaxID=2681415 RepID=UPI001357E045|nr:type III secretion system chaperone [Pantoea sp. 18069]
MHDPINRLLADFGNALGLDGLSLDESGYCCLSFDQVVVNIESVGESSLVLLYSSLGALPADAGPEVCRRLLEANYFFQGTAGATIGLDTASGAVAITRVVDAAGMDTLDWEAAIKAFVDAAESCAGLLSAEPLSTERIAAPPQVDAHILRA